MLELKNIHKTFNPGTINEKVALNGLNLSLDDGDFVTVIGGNGAGKSTMLNAVAGTWMVEQGQILIDPGEDVTKLPEHKRAIYLGRVFQDPMTGTAATMEIQNLALAKRPRQAPSAAPGITKAEREEYVSCAPRTARSRLRDTTTSKVGLLSGGQRRTLTLLMATLKSRLLLLDEHTRPLLDPKTAAKVLDLTETIVNRDRLTTIMITHNMRDAILHGNRLIMMWEGRVVLDIRGEEKKHLTVNDLLQQFEKASGEQFANDQALLG